MATKLRAAIAATGPDGQNSAWFDGGNSFNFPAISATTTLQNFPAQIITRADTQLAGGLYQPDSLVPQGGIAAGVLPIQRLNGAQIVLAALFAAAANLTLGIRIMRSIDFLGAGIAAAGGALTSIPLGAPLSTALASGAQFALTNAAGTTQLWTTSAAVPAGTLAIPVVGVHVDELVDLPDIVSAAEDLQTRRAGIRDVPVRVDDGDDVRQVQDQRAEALLTLSQRFLGLTSGRDVARGHDEALDRRVVEQIVADDLDDAPRSVGVPDANLRLR